MKKTIVIFCAALAAFGLSAFGLINWNDSGTDRMERPVSSDIVIDKSVPGKMDQGILVGPRELKNGHWIPYLTVAPEKQAEYEGGIDALMEYLKENSKEARGSVRMDELPPFKLLFTVTKKGTIEDVRLEGTSGYLSINNRMIELITKAPGKWEPAENSKGEKVDWELVVSFGSTGC